MDFYYTMILLVSIVVRLVQKITRKMQRVKEVNTSDTRKKIHGGRGMCLIGKFDNGVHVLISR